MDPDSVTTPLLQIAKCEGTDVKAFATLTLLQICRFNLRLEVKRKEKH